MQDSLRLTASLQDAWEPATKSLQPWPGSLPMKRPTSPVRHLISMGECTLSEYAGKTLLFIGGGMEALPGIEKARDLGLHVVVSDMNPRGTWHAGRHMADWLPARTM